MYKVAFLFPGQGSQYVGMSKTFYDHYPIARQTFEEANDILGFDLSKLCFEGRLTDLNSAENLQPLLLTTSIAAYRVYMQDIGIRPEFCAGHSMGEYSALVCSGAIKFSDALKITRSRGLLINEIISSNIGAMTIIDNVNKVLVEEECLRASKDNKFVVVSCVNSQTQIAISGYKEMVEQVEMLLLDKDAQVTPLIASAPIHSPLMESVAYRLKNELEKVKYYPFKWPVISNVTGEFYKNSDEIPELLKSHMTNTVLWLDTMKNFEKYGITLTIEFGPKNVLSKLVKASTSGIETICYDQIEDRMRLSDYFLSDVNIKKKKVSVITKCLAAAVATPNYNYDNDEYKEGVINPYSKLKFMQEELEHINSDPTTEMMIEALELLSKILNTKKLPIKEQEEWFYNIIDDTNTYYALKEFQILKKL